MDTHRVHSAKASFSAICGSEKMEIKLSNSTCILQYYKEILEPDMKSKKKKTKHIKTLLILKQNIRTLMKWIDEKAFIPEVKTS